MGKKRKRRQRAALLLMTAVMVFACTACKEEEKQEPQKKVTLTLWYTDEGMTGYVESAAEEYEKEYGVELQCEVIDAKQYLEQVYSASIDEEQAAPDIYLLRNDLLGLACMQGTVQTNLSETYVEKNYCKTALEAATYQGKLMGYPLYYNTSCMVYNADSFGETPATMGAITAYSENEQISENIQYILYWNVNDYFCNYSFVGNYLDIGGQSGDDAGSISIVNDETVQCLQQFQGLGQYFAIDSTAANANIVPGALMEGRALCILADCDMVHIISYYEENHGAAVPYRICRVPDITDELKSCSGSYTELVIVNGLSLQQEAAAAFAEYLTSDYVDRMYKLSGHFAAKRGVEYSNEELCKLYEIYEQSKQFPKLLETEDNGLWLEILFANVWKGEDIATELQSYSDKITSRLNR